MTLTPDAVAEELFVGILDTLRRKNHDYTQNAGDPYANFRLSTLEGVDPRTGILIRVQDKLQRIRTHIRHDRLMVAGEGVEDAIRDVIGYMVLLYGLEEERRTGVLHLAAPATGLDVDAPCACPCDGGCGCGD